LVTLAVMVGVLGLAMICLPARGAARARPGTGRAGARSHRERAISDVSVLRPPSVDGLGNSPLSLGTSGTLGASRLNEFADYYTRFERMEEEEAKRDRAGQEDAR
jgi:hypothetical protein